MFALIYRSKYESPQIISLVFGVELQSFNSNGSARRSSTKFKQDLLETSAALIFVLKSAKLSKFFMI